MNFPATWNFVPTSLHSEIAICASLVFLLIAIIFTYSFAKRKGGSDSGFHSFLWFFYASFLKPHETSDEGGQQFFLESFYKAQASVYDSTRKRLLRGREDMLGLVAAQLKYKLKKKTLGRSRPVWVDIGGGTGYNIEAMSAYVPVESFFSRVYLVDLSPSLCEVARKRFQRLGWGNVIVVCQDARTFRLEEYEPGNAVAIYSSEGCSENSGADLITMSYSLSMIPDFYSVIDSLSSLLSPFGTIGVCDFYVQSIVDLSSRNYVGGVFNRHVNWLSRVFWRAWFDVDRVSLEGARRDYLEYRFGTVLSVSDRNHLLGWIPYYIFVGCPKKIASLRTSSPDFPQQAIEALDASFTESPYLSPTHHQNQQSKAARNNSPIGIRSKAYESAIVNLSANLPLPSAFYQNDHWRIFYNDQLKKHTQFGDEYIYAFTWEDPRIDHRLLKIGSDDVILAITSAGDNILDYLLHNPRRVHAVDLNPNQNHLLELKVAAFTALGYEGVWRLFGEGKHSKFRDLLISKLSSHMSSQAFQYWLENASVFSNPRGMGLYETGGSRVAIKLVRYLFKCFGLSATVKKLCEAKTLNEQREIWPRIRSILLSRPLHWAVISTEWFCWKAAGVPKEQYQMILQDHARLMGIGSADKQSTLGNGEAVWDYVVNTLDPIVENTLLRDDNYFYLLCLQGKYSRRCHPEYLTPRTHAKFSKLNAFDGLRIHTDEINEVLTRITSGTLTIAVIMDSMDWFTPSSPAAQIQISALNRALKAGGRVLLRSAGLDPWYVKVFEECGFTTRRVQERFPGKYVDSPRNMTRRHFPPLEHPYALAFFKPSWAFNVRRQHRFAGGEHEHPDA
ncbi:MAG: hypothetical protein M1834_006640 [Cirrosporium novae-zelandiae]|nr:MAG: hypothetical protein M1834_006640 [Cirrosporium novae-zelandiae]